MRVTLVIASLRGRGAERVAIIGEPLAGRGWEVTLLTYDDGREAPAYALSAAVDHRCLGIESSSRGAFEAVRNNLEFAGHDLAATILTQAQRCQLSRGGVAQLPMMGQPAAPNAPPAVGPGLTTPPHRPPARAVATPVSGVLP